MELINQTKTNFKVGKNKEGNDIVFRIGEVREFGDALGKTLLRYEGINSLESLKVKSEKVFTEAKESLKVKSEKSKK